MSNGRVRKQSEEEKDKYIPSDSEEYLSAAIQEQKCIFLHACSLISLQEELKEKGVAIIEDIVKSVDIKNFINHLPNFSSNQEALIGLDDSHIYEGESHLANAVKKLKKSRALKNLWADVKKCLDSTFSGKTRFLENESFLRCKGIKCSTVEHSDFFHYQGKIIQWIEKSQSIVVRKLSVLLINQTHMCYGACDDLVKLDILQCPCGVWAHKRCLAVEFTIESLNWLCDSCADSPYSMYTAWINLTDIDTSSSILGFISGSHLLGGFGCRYKCRKVQFKIFLI